MKVKSVCIPNEEFFEWKEQKNERKETQISSQWGCSVSKANEENNLKATKFSSLPKRSQLKSNTNSITSGILFLSLGF